jgi:5-methylcytosine-specific restriction endonuclease McrA
MTETEYKNQYHPYLKHRRDFCENRDGRLGYRCRYKIRHSAQLQVDHINGNPRDNSVTNLQTLCANCHVFKTHANQDYRTPGRKTLKCQ